MKSFSTSLIAAWRDGRRMPYSATLTTQVVHYDTRSRAYEVAAEDREKFINWVAFVWASENEPQEDDEPNEEYLDRIGLTVTQIA